MKIRLLTLPLVFYLIGVAMVSISKVSGLDAREFRIETAEVMPDKDLTLLAFNAR